MECPQCGTMIEVDVSDFDRSVREIDRSLARLDRQIGKIGG
jgi:transcription initiation factor IIE alpha subunit